MKGAGSVRQSMDSVNRGDQDLDDRNLDQNLNQTQKSRDLTGTADLTLSL